MSRLKSVLLLAVLSLAACRTGGAYVARAELPSPAVDQALPPHALPYEMGPQPSVVVTPLRW